VQLPHLPNEYREQYVQRNILSAEALAQAFGDGSQGRPRLSPSLICTQR
jgi:hypothetical protein